MNKDLLTTKQRQKIVVGIIIAAALLLLYFAGAIGQYLQLSYEYKLAGGLGSDAVMGNVDFNPFVCFVKAFTARGIKALFGELLVVGLAGGYIVWYLHKDNVDSDERGFSVSRNGTYGTASWMGKKELQEILELKDIDEAEGVILGEKYGKAVCMPKDTRLNRHIAIFGASGTMKSRAVMRHALFQSLKRGESVVITDPKGELYGDTAVMYKKNGYDVKVYNLVDPLHSDSWNCMGDLVNSEGTVDTLLAQKLADIIIGNTGDSKGGTNFWDNGEGNLLKAVILFVMENDAIEPERKNLGTVYEYITKSYDELCAEFSIVENNPYSSARQAWSLFKQSGSQICSNIISGIGSRLQVLQNPAVTGIVSKTDIDLTAPGKRKSAYFVITSDQDSTMKFISSLFFSFLFIRLTEYADRQPAQCCDVPVNLVLDEFNNVGKIGGASDGSDFARTMSVCRSRGLRVMIAVQSLGQLQNRYANNLWAEIIGNCDIQLMLGCTDDITAEYFSGRSGEMTIMTDSTREQHRTFAVAEMIPVYQKSTGEGKRALLTADEVLRFPNTEMLVVIRGHNLLRVNKLDYTKHPMSNDIVKARVSEYIPDDPNEYIRRVNNRDIAPTPIHTTKPSSNNTNNTENNRSSFAGKLSSGGNNSGNYHHNDSGSTGNTGNSGRTKRQGGKKKNNADYSILLESDAKETNNNQTNTSNKSENKRTEDSSVEYVSTDMYRMDEAFDPWSPDNDDSDSEGLFEEESTFDDNTTNFNSSGVFKVSDSDDLDDF